MSTIENQPSPTTSMPAASTPLEQFIPLRAADLVDLLAARPELSPQDADAFRRLCSQIQAILHREYQATLGELKDAYAPFDPDADTCSGAELSPELLTLRRDVLFDRFEWLMARGNFVRLAQSEIDRALAERSQWGLNLAVDFTIFDRLEIYFRGDSIGKRYRRRLRNRMRSEAVEVPVYQRLVVIFHLRPQSRLAKLLDTQDVHIKFFKDIPKVDLDMLLPGTHVKMSLFDRAKIMLPTLSGLSIVAWKIAQALFFATAVGIYGTLTILGLIGGTLGYGARSFYGYLNTKQKYQLSLTQSLYYQNLDNNAGVIYRLLDEAEEQENREAVLAYFYLWRHAPASGWSAAELDQQVEALLYAQVGQGIDFEVSDALAKLERLALLDACPDNKWKAASIDQAIDTLHSRWMTMIV